MVVLFCLKVIDKRPLCKCNIAERCVLDIAIKRRYVKFLKLSNIFFRLEKVEIFSFAEFIVLFILLARPKDSECEQPCSQNLSMPIT